jgi:hypothetical protein
MGDPFSELVFTLFPLPMTAIAPRKGFRMVTFEAEVDGRFGQSRYFSGSRVFRMLLMAI